MTTLNLVGLVGQIIFGIGSFLFLLLLYTTANLKLVTILIIFVIIFYVMSIIAIG